MFYLKEIKVLSLIAASSFALLTGNSLKASEDYPSGIYGTMSIGAGEITNFDDGLGTDLEFDIDVIYEIGLGYDFGKTFRADISYNGGSSGFDGDPLGIEDGDFKFTGFMATGYLDFPIENTKWEPFIGLGLGTMEVDAEEACTVAANTDCTESAFSYSLSGGVNYALSPTSSITGKITYMNIGDITISNAGVDVDLTEITSLSALVGIKFMF